MILFKKGDRVVKVLNCGGIRTGTIKTVAAVRKGNVRLEGSEEFRYDAGTGRERDEFATGMWSTEIVKLEEGE